MQASDLDFRDDVLLPGTIVDGRYRVEELLAWGGMGVVYRAVHLELGSDVAVKTMRRELLDDDSTYERFVREARNAAKLTTSHVAKVFDFGRMNDGRPYLVMEYLQGESLSARLQRGVLSNAETARYLIEACAALADAHAHGIVHRDLKPDNLFLCRSVNGVIELKVLDFGIAKSLTPFRPNLTLAGGVGSPTYMAPEQMRARPDLDHRADIWSLGAVAYELVSGEPAYDGQTVTEICAKVLTEDPRPLRSVCAGIWPELDAIVSRCLERDPNLRFSDVLELSRALQDALEVHGGSGRPSGPRPVLELVPSSISVLVTPEAEGGAVTESNLDVSAELSQISGLAPRRWPKVLAVGAGLALLAGGAWTWWVGYDRVVEYVRYELGPPPSAPAFVDEAPVRRALVPTAAFVTPRQSVPPARVGSAVVPAPAAPQRKIVMKQMKKKERKLASEPSEEMTLPSTIEPSFVFEEPAPAEPTPPADAVEPVK